MRDFVNFVKAHIKLIGAAYAAFILVFFFIGLPGHKGILTYVIGFLVLTAVFLAFVLFIKKSFIDQKW